MQYRDKYSIYVHIPFCKARCGYCAFSSCTDLNFQKRYFDKLCDEIEYFSDRSVPIYTVYLGGGTPSVVQTSYLDALFAKLNDCFDLSQAVETTVECNPESTGEQLLNCLKNNGVNRLSFGLQSVNDATLKKIGRLHTFDGFLNALNEARAFGFDNVSADLIIGLPESHRDFLHSVQTVAALPLTHVSVYALELYENTALYNALNGRKPFSDDEQADMYDEAVDVLAKHGFCRYEISNFAKQGMESKHNLNYWREGRYFAFGAAASGFVKDVRYVNSFSVNDYLSTPTQLLHQGEREQISLREQANEFAMLGLRLESGVDTTEFADRYGVDFFEFFSAARRLKKDGFLSVNGNRVRVPADKFYVLNSILAELWHSDVEDN